MGSRKDFSKEARKSKPFTVRFPNTFMQDVKKRKGLVKGQPIADFLVDLYNQVFNPIVGNPVLERNEDRPRIKQVMHPNGENGILIPAGGQKQSQRPQETPESTISPKAKDVAARIAEIEVALKKGAPSDYSPLAKKNYLFDLKKELKQLKDSK